MESLCTENADRSRDKTYKGHGRCKRVEIELVRSREDLWRGWNQTEDDYIEGTWNRGSEALKSRREVFWVYSLGRAT